MEILSWLGKRADPLPARICVCAAQTLKQSSSGKLNVLEEVDLSLKEKSQFFKKIPEKLEKWETTLFYFILKQSTFVESWCWFVNINDLFGLLEKWLHLIR